MNYRYYISRIGLIAVAVSLLLLFTMISVRLAIANQAAPQPEAILVLGGNPQRETAAAQLARFYANLPVWVSSGEAAQKAHEIFDAADIPTDRVHLDYRATDTVTNFTTLVNDLKQHQIQHVFLVTSDFHMPRAKAIATIVLGSRGIAFTPVEVPSRHPREPVLQIARDVGRSIVWLATGHTGTRFRSMRNTSNV